MASREVVVSICDRCTTEVSAPLSRKGKKHSDLVLPQGWLHIAGNTATTLVFEMDLCAECKQIVIEAAGRARQVHSTSSRAKAKQAVASQAADAQQEDKASKADVRQEDKALVSIG
jgi:hypothetical protein